MNIFGWIQEIWVWFDLRRQVTFNYLVSTNFWYCLSTTARLKVVAGREGTVPPPKIVPTPSLLPWKTWNMKNMKNPSALPYQPNIFQASPFAFFFFAMFQVSPKWMGGGGSCHIAWVNHLTNKVDLDNLISMWLSSLFQYMVSVFIFVILFLHGRFLET